MKDYPMIAKNKLRAHLIAAMQKAGTLSIKDTITKEEWSDWIQYWCDRTNQPEEIRHAKYLTYEQAKALGTWLGYPQIAES